MVSGLDTEMASVDIEFWSRVWDEGILRYPSYKRFMTASNSCCWKVKNVNLRRIPSVVLSLWELTNMCVVKFY